MDASTITVHWHDDNQPIYSLDIQPQQQTSPTTDEQPYSRLATAGGDNNIRIWGISTTSPNLVEYRSTLTKHSQAINVVRFNPSGTTIATAGDDGTLFLWKMSSVIIRNLDNENDQDLKESWYVVGTIRSSTAEVMDLAWSPTGDYIVTGSMDNTMRVYKLTDTGKKKIDAVMIACFTDHSHYIQGVAWDPRGRYIASQSADRSMNVYEAVGGTLDVKLVHKFQTFRNRAIYCSETLPSFFRRLAFSPDGLFLVTPAGLEESGAEKAAESTNTSTDPMEPQQPKEPQEQPQSVSPPATFKYSIYIYARSRISTSPVIKLCGLSKPAVAVSFSPVKYTTTNNTQGNSLDIPYKLVFAVATLDTVIIYSTDDAFRPLGQVSNLHYQPITDLVWSHDGMRLIASSVDGFCSTITFEEGKFGQVYTGPDVAIPEKKPTNTTTTPTITTEPEKKQEDKPKTIDSFFNTDKKVTKKAKKRITPTLIQ
ncbi:uncharacterized protein LODBEIA_P55970 [Lodderomyces beijingensis]|uniref:CAF1B/HIR1 beta-propeller domain-containing protein n=1 Tax=Lodderomyces beijingensis TaxID=1775926 RepID=A0ABP0ZUP8_9ASCO